MQYGSPEELYVTKLEPEVAVCGTSAIMKFVFGDSGHVSAADRYIQPF